MLNRGYKPKTVQSAISEIVKKGRKKKKKTDIIRAPLVTQLGLGRPWNTT